MKLNLVQDNKSINLITDHDLAAATKLIVELKMHEKNTNNQRIKISAPIFYDGFKREVNNTFTSDPFQEKNLVKVIKTVN